MAKQQIVLIFLAFLLLVSAKRSGQDWQKSFNKWRSQYNKVYHDIELDRRFQIFKENAQYIYHHNHKSHSYTLALNEFADLTDEEFTQRYLLSAPQPNCSATKGSYILHSVDDKLPNAVDWRQKGVVSAVKNQGTCGSCWTFSTTGAMESHWTIVKGVKKLFSEQQLVDCAQAFDNHGCEGGLPSHAFEYIRYNGLTTEDQYVYHGKDQKCQYTKSMAVGSCAGSQNITQGAENELVDAIANVGPVSIAFEVASDFRFYKDGVYNSKVCKSGPQNVNHAVLAVGYNSTVSNMPYYIIKNSWGATWGMDGYFLMIRDKNMCGIATCASYPLVN